MHAKTTAVQPDRETFCTSTRCTTNSMEEKEWSLVEAEEDQEIHGNEDNCSSLPDLLCSERRDEEKEYRARENRWREQWWTAPNDAISQQINGPWCAGTPASVLTQDFVCYCWQQSTQSCLFVPRNWAHNNVEGYLQHHIKTCASLETQGAMVCDIIKHVSKSADGCKTTDSSVFIKLGRNNEKKDIFQAKGDCELKCICGWDKLLLYLSGTTVPEEWNSLCILGQMDVIRQSASGWILDLHLLFRWVRVENPFSQIYVTAKARSSSLLLLYSKHGESFWWDIQNWSGFVLYMGLYVPSAVILYR